MPKVSINPNNLSALAGELAAVFASAPGNLEGSGWVEALASVVSPSMSGEAAVPLSQALRDKVEAARRSYVERHGVNLEAQGLTFCSESGLSAFFFSALYETLRFGTDGWSEERPAPENGRRKRAKRRGAAYFVSPSLAYFAAWRAMDAYYEGRSEDSKPPRILDPAMGTGLYLVAAVDYMRGLNIAPVEAARACFGLEIDAITCSAARCAMAIAIGAPNQNREPGTNLLWADAISVARADSNFAPGSFDIVLGNPPWDIVKTIYEGSSSRTNKARIAALRQGLAFQGEGDTSYYKIFLELSYNWLRSGGVGAILLPAAFCGDKGAAPLRGLIFDNTALLSLDSFINEDCVFDIHQSFRYVLLSFLKEPPSGEGAVSRWEAFPCRFGLIAGQSVLVAPVQALSYPRSAIEQIGGEGRAILEPADNGDLTLMLRLYAAQASLGSLLARGHAFFRREFDMTGDRDIFIESILKRNAAATDHLPLYEGRMVGQFDHAKSGAEARYFVRREDFVRRVAEGEFKIGFVSVTSALNTRSVVAAYLPPLPAGNSLPTLVFRDAKPAAALSRALYTVAMLNSFVFDWLVRQRLTGTNLNYHLLGDMPLPDPAALPADLLGACVRLAASLSLPGGAFPREREILDEAGLDCYLEPDSYPTSGPALRLRARIWLEILALHFYDCSPAEAAHVLADCSRPSEALARRRRLGRARPEGSEPAPRSFFRVDKSLPPEQRLPNLVLTAYKLLMTSQSKPAGHFAPPDFFAGQFVPLLPDPVEASLERRYANTGSEQVVIFMA